MCFMNRHSYGTRIVIRQNLLQRQIQVITGRHLHYLMQNVNCSMNFCGKLVNAAFAFLELFLSIVFWRQWTIWQSLTTYKIYSSFAKGVAVTYFYCCSKSKFGQHKMLHVLSLSIFLWHGMNPFYTPIKQK